MVAKPKKAVQVYLKVEVTLSQKYAHLFNRRGVASAVLQTASQFIDWLTD